MPCLISYRSCSCSCGALLFAASIVFSWSLTLQLLAPASRAGGKPVYHPFATTARLHDEHELPTPLPQRPPLPPAAEPLCSAWLRSFERAPPKRSGRLLVLGIISAPNNAARRLWIRHVTSPFAAPHKIEVRFVIGARGLSTARCMLTRRESAEHRDLQMLDAHDDDAWARASHGIGVSCIDKTFQWFTHALYHYPGALFLGKADDDQYLSVPNLAAILWAIDTSLDAEESDVYAGWVQYASYRTSDFKMCGWNPSAHAAIRLAETSCDPVSQKSHSQATRGAQDQEDPTGPFPFVVGALEIFSAGLARKTFGSIAVQKFLHRARDVAEGGAASHLARWINNHEDPTVGYVVQDAAMRQGFNVTLVALNGFRFESPIVVDATDEVHLARLPALVAVHRAIQNEPELALMATMWLDGFGNRTLSKEQADMRHLADVNWRVAPLLAELLRDLRNRTQRQVTRLAMGQYRLVCREPSAIRARADAGGNTRHDGDSITWTEAPIITTLPCCKRWRVCWLM